MPRKPQDPRCTQALRVMRSLLEKGITDETTLVSEAAAAIDKPGTEGAQIIAQQVFDRKLKITQPN